MNNAPLRLALLLAKLGSKRVILAVPDTGTDSLAMTLKKYVLASFLTSNNRIAHKLRSEYETCVPHSKPK